MAWAITARAGTSRKSEINAQMIAAARQGKTVVRLKAGDPCVFGCLAEEVAALRAAGVPLEIIPGATAGLAVAAYAEIPVTHAQAASAVALITGHQRKEKSSPPLDYAALGRLSRHADFLHGRDQRGRVERGVDRRGKVARHAGGRRPPLLVARSRDRPRDAGHRGRDLGGARNPPAGGVRRRRGGGLAPESSWFSQRPLFGVGVLVTRPVEQAHELRDRLTELGANVFVQPAIEIGPPPDWAAVDAALARLDRYDWLVFSSGNGVRWFLDRLLAGGGDLRRLGGVKLAAIGPGTAAELAKYHLKADLMPEEYRAESLAEALFAERPGGRFSSPGRPRPPGLARTAAGRRRPRSIRS